MCMHRVTVKNLVTPHYQPRNTYVHTYIQYTCDIRFLQTTHAFMISIDLPSSLSLSWHSRSTSWNTYDQGPPHMYTHSPLGRLAPLLSSSRPDTGSRGTSQCTPDRRIPVWDRLEVTRAMWADIRIYVNGVIPLYISLSLEQQWAMQCTWLATWPYARVLPHLEAGAWARQLYTYILF